MYASATNNPQIILQPEGCEITKTLDMTPNIAENAWKKNYRIPAKIIGVDLNRREFTTSLGNNYVAALPFEDSVLRSSIQMVNKKGELAAYSKSLIDQYVYVLISDIDKFGHISVTRKPLLSQAYQKVCEHCKNQNSIFKCRVMYCTEASAMVDIGGGIMGIIPIQELSTMIYKDITKWIYPGQTFGATLSKFERLKNMFILSRKRFYSMNPKIPKLNETIWVQAGHRTDSNPFGLYVQIDPGIAGVLNKPRLQYSEGHYIKATVSRIIPDKNVLCGYRIQLIEKK